MQQQLTAHQFPEVYKNLGIDLGKLGCIMLDTEPLQVSDVIAEEDLYVSETKQYVKGVVSEVVPHCTLLYGLMRSGPELQPHVDAVLEGWGLDSVEVAQVIAFESPDPEEPYYTLVAELVVTAGLLEGNARLRMLPHIDDLPTYRPHITLAYIKKDDAKRDQYIEALNERFMMKAVGVEGVNYGD